MLTDLEGLLPHSKKDSKVDIKRDLFIINELAELNNCNNCIFFEVRKRQDLYMWLAKTPNGPSVKLHVQNCKCPHCVNVSDGGAKSSKCIPWTN